MEEDLKKAAEILAEGGVILYPTDTIWGIGCDATNEKAVEKIYRIKRRDHKKSMISLVDSIETLRKYVGSVPEEIEDLLAGSDEPVTVIYPRVSGLAANLPADDQSVALRITNESYSKKLCKVFGKPIVSTSANFSGRSFPACFEEIDPEMTGLVDYVASYGHQPGADPRKPSRIIKLGLDNELIIIR